MCFRYLYSVLYIYIQCVLYIYIYSVLYISDVYIYKHTQCFIYIYSVIYLYTVSRSVTIVVFYSSNCVINLSPDKQAVLREAHAVLKVLTVVALLYCLW